MKVSKNTANSIFWTLCIMGFFAILSSTMAKSPVLKIFSKSLNTPTELSGFVASASTIPGILISLPAASLSDIYGRRKFLLIAGLVFASAPFLYLLITVWWHLILVRFYHGFATAIFVPVAEAAVAESFPTKRGERISLFSSATYVGRVIAPTLGGYILFVTADNFHSLYLAVGIAGITAVIMAFPFLTGKKGLELTQHEKVEGIAKKVFHGWRTVVKCPGVLLVSFVQACQFYVYGSAEYYLSGYLPEVVRLNGFLTGIIITSIIGVGIFARPYMGRVSDRVGRRIPIVAGCVLSSLPMFVIPFIADLWLLLLLAAVYGLGLATVMGSIHALISDLVPKELVGTSMGFIDTVMDVGQTLGPIISGFILGISMNYGLQYTLVFPSLGIVLLLAAGVFASSKAAETRQKPLHRDKTRQQSSRMNNLGRLLRIEPANKTEHLLFNLYNFNFFRKSERGKAIMFFEGSKLSALLMAVPYILGCELAFFREKRYFVKLKEHVAGIFVLREKLEALYIGSLAVAPEYRRWGLATYMLNYSAKVANRLGKSWLELTVLKKNTPARLFYEKLGFVKKEERKRSLVLTKRVKRDGNPLG